MLLCTLLQFSHGISAWRTRHPTPPSKLNPVIRNSSPIVIFSSLLHFLHSFPSYLLTSVLLIALRKSTLTQPHTVCYGLTAVYLVHHRCSIAYRLSATTLTHHHKNAISSRLHTKLTSRSIQIQDAGLGIRTIQLPGQSLLLILVRLVMRRAGMEKCHHPQPRKTLRGTRNKKTRSIS